MESKDVKNALSAKISELRKSKGMVQKQLIDDAGISSSLLRIIETKNHIPKEETIQKIGAALKLTEEESAGLMQLATKERENALSAKKEAHKRDAPSCSTKAPTRSAISRVRDSELHMFEVAYLLLLLDQFPETGIWGASLEKAQAGPLYGHTESDPGSISVSTLSCIAIANLKKSTTSQCIQAFHKYLITRQSDGAFGRRKMEAVGSRRIPTIEKHGRHTAMALRFLMICDGLENSRVQDSLTYILKQRTPSGLWVDLGLLQDQNSDPITVAVVVDTLGQVEAQLKQTAERRSKYKVLISQIHEAIETGLEYLFDENVRTGEGFWHYKIKPESKELVLGHLYQYTTDVLFSICPLCESRRVYLSEINLLIKKLFGIWGNYRSLPKSPNNSVGDLDASARFILATHSLRAWQRQTKEAYRNLIAMCLRREIIEAGGANGWSAILQVACLERLGKRLFRSPQLTQIEDIARGIRANGISYLPDEFREYQFFIENLLSRQKSVTAT